MSAVTQTPFFACGPSGFAGPGSGETVVSICAYCPDRAGSEAAARKRHPGAVLSHGICPACRERVEAEMRVARLIDEARQAGTATVEQHPQGGWTHGIPTGDSAARIFAGWWPTRRAAREALGQCR